MTEESGDNATAAECISKCQTDTVKEIMCVAVFSCFVKKNSNTANKILSFLSSGLYL